MSESNALVKLFNDLMGSMDSDDEKKAQGLIPEPPQLDIPPMVTPQVPVQEDWVDPDAPPGFDPSKLVPDPITPEEQAMLASEQGVPELLARPQPSLGFDGIPTLESVQPPPAQVDSAVVPVVEEVGEGTVPPEIVEPEPERSGLMDFLAGGKPQYVTEGFEEMVASPEMQDQLSDLAEWAKENPAEAAAAGLSMIPVVRVGGAISTGIVNAISKVNFGKLPKRFAKIKNIFVKTKTQKSKTTRVQEPGKPGKYNPVAETTTTYNVPAIAGVGAAGLYGASEVGEALLPDEVPVAEAEVDEETTAIVESDANIEDKKKIDALIDGTGDGTGDGGGDKIVADPKDPSFLSKLWDGVKGVVSEQFQDPVNQKALFAYAISRALGYDGATIAGKVLEDGWSRQAALEKIYGKQTVDAEKKRIEDEKIDYSKPITVYHPKTQKNYTIFRTKGGDKFVWEVGGGTKGVDISTLLADGYQFKEGLTRQDHRDSMLKTLTADTARAFDHISSEDIDDETKAAIRKGIDPAELRSAIDNFVGQYPKGTDFVNSNVMNSISKAAGNYVQAIKDGRAVGSRDLTGWLDYEVLKHDIKDNGLPSTFFAISKHPDQEIGVNGWSKVNHKVNGLMQSINSQLLKANKDAQPMTKGEVYKALYDEYVKMAEASIDPKDKDDNPFATYWEKASVESSDDEHLSLSPAMLWIQNIDKRPDPSYSPPNGGALIKTLVANRLGKS